MNPWVCALIIFAAGGVGGVVNALLTDNGFVLPQRIKGILCPGFLSNVLVGALASFTSWSLYGSGAGVDLARHVNAGDERAQISLTFSALAGALFVGIAGARWITNEVDKLLLKETVKVAADKHLPKEQCEEIVRASPRRALKAVTTA
jgi:hypothetical protein